MKSILFSLSLLLASTAGFAQSTTVQSLPLNSDVPMPTTLLMGINGTKTSLAQARTSKGLLVMFSCNTCPYVIKSQQRTKDAIEMAQKMGVGMVIINSNEAQRNDADSYEAMKKYGRAQGYKVPYVADENAQMANAFGATRTPEVYLFNANGKLVYKGAMEDNPSEPEKSTAMYLSQAMQQMTAGKKVAVAETKSIGCSIKRVAKN